MLTASVAVLRLGSSLGSGGFARPDSVLDLSESCWLALLSDGLSVSQGIAVVVTIAWFAGIKLDASLQKGSEIKVKESVVGSDSLPGFVG